MKTDKITVSDLFEKQRRYLERANEAVEKVPDGPRHVIFGGHLTPPEHQIVDCSAFYEVAFSRFSPRILLGDFFYSFNAVLTGAPPGRVRCDGLLDGSPLLHQVCRRPRVANRGPAWFGHLLPFPYPPSKPKI